MYVFARAKGKHQIYLCTEPEFIELGDAAIAVFPYPRKAEMIGDEQNLNGTFAWQLDEFNQRFEQRPGCYKLFFGHFGVAGARVSGGQPLVGRCAECPLDPLRSLKAQYVGLSHIHFRQELAPRIWYAGSLSRCDYSEVEDKGYNLVTLHAPDLRQDLSDLDIEFRVSPTRRMVELHAVYENGELRLPDNLDPLILKDSRVKVVVTVPNGPDHLLSREQQDNLREKLLAAFAGKERWFFLDVFEGGPAHAAGVKRGDMLPAVNGTEYLPPTMPPFDVGQTYDLRIADASGENIRHVSAKVPTKKGTRSRPPIVEPKPLSHAMVAPGVGLLRVTYFPGELGIGFANALDPVMKSLKEGGANRLIIDLRGNIGGGLGLARLAS